MLRLFSVTVFISTCLIRPVLASYDINQVTRIDNLILFHKEFKGSNHHAGARYIDDDIYFITSDKVTVFGVVRINPVGSHWYSPIYGGKPYEGKGIQYENTDWMAIDCRNKEKIFLDSNEITRFKIKNPDEMDINEKKIYAKWPWKAYQLVCNSSKPRHQLSKTVEQVLSSKHPHRYNVYQKDIDKYGKTYKQIQAMRIGDPKTFCSQSWVRNYEICLKYNLEENRKSQEYRLGDDGMNPVKITTQNNLRNDFFETIDDNFFEY